jgi:light-regulated signal transduction histidine kinase (bacteriophytochrome)
MDFQVKSLSADQLASLQMLARQVVNVLELRKANLRLLQLKKELEASNEELQKFAYVVSHDIKSPLSSIVLSSEMLRENFGDSIDEGDDQLLKVLNRSAFKIRNLVDGILIYYRSERAMGEAVESFPLKPFLFSVAEMIGVNQDADIKIFAGEVNVKTKKAALEHILMNLLQYTLRNSENKKLQVNIRFSQDDSNYFFNISGIGNSLSETEEKEISELFATPGFSERFGTNSDLIGLSAVKKMVEKLSGKIELSTLHGKGSEFSFHIRKES